MIRILEEQVYNSSQEIARVKQAFTDANIFINGISRYLIYVLKVFKAYSADFLTEDNVYEINYQKNYQLNLDSIETYYDGLYWIGSVDGRPDEGRWNVSQYDIVEIDGKFDYNDTIAYQTNTDSVFVITPYGDIRIESS